MIPLNVAPSSRYTRKTVQAEGAVLETFRELLHHSEYENTAKQNILLLQIKLIAYWIKVE